jgi:hypothetical protein
MMTQLPLFKDDLPEVTSPKLWLAGRILWIAVLLRAVELPFNQSGGDQRSHGGGLSLRCKKDLTERSVQRAKDRFKKVKKRLKLDGLPLPIGRLLRPPTSDLVKRYLNQAGLMHQSGLEFIKNEQLVLIPSNNNDPEPDVAQDKLLFTPENPFDPRRDLPG